VLLVLLIIFMVVTPTKPSSFKAKIPQEPIEDGAEPHPDTLIVTVDQRSMLGINRETALGSVDDPQQLVKRLKDVFESRRISYMRTGGSDVPTAVFIKAPRGMDYGSVARVVDAVKSSGAYPIALQIDDLN
jgi:biopolymer transport protein ExbD